MTERQKKLILTAAIVVFAAAIMVVAWLKFQNFGYNGFDLAIYNQTFWNTVHGRFFANSMNPPSYLGDHAEWPILVLAPLYALVPHPLTLILLQTLALGLSSLIIYKIAQKYFPGRRLDLFFALLWLANPFVWNLALFEFHIIAFAVPLILLAAHFYLQKKWLLFMATVVGICAVREDLFLVVLGFSALALFDIVRRPTSFRGANSDEESQRHNDALRSLTAFGMTGTIIKWVVVPAIIGIIIFFFDQTVITHFNPDGRYKFLIYYEWLGKTPFDILTGALMRPLTVIKHIFTWTNLEVAFVLLLPTLFLPLRRPRFLLLCAGMAMEFLLTQTGVDMVLIKAQYVTPFLPALALATIEGYARLNGYRHPVEKRGPEQTAVDPGFRRDDNKLFWKIVPRPLFPFFIVIATVVVWFGFGPGTGIATSFAAPDGRRQALRTSVDMIPDNVSVVSSFDALASLSSRAQVYPMAYVWLGQKQFATSAYTLPDKPDYLLLDNEDFKYFTAVYRSATWSTKYYTQGAERLRKLISEGNYGPVLEKNNVALLKRGAGNTWPFVKVYKTAPKIEHPSDAASGSIRFWGWNKDADDIYRLYFSTNTPVVGNPVLIVNEKIFTLGNGLYPAADWQSNEIIEVGVFDVESPLTIKIADINGGLFINGDGSLSLNAITIKTLGPKIIAP